MSGSTQSAIAATLGGSDLTRLVLALQESVKASYLIQQTLAKGIQTNTTAPAYTVANLPVSAPIGQLAFASNGRNTGQGAGTGTGCLVVGNGTSWTAVWSGVTVTA
jgi:hypothetical protein